MNIILLEFGLCLAASMVAVGRTKPVDVGQQPTNVSSNTTEQRDFLGWHCNDDTVRQVVTDALTLHGSDIDLTQQYIQTNLNSLFQQTGGVWLVSVSHIIRASDNIDDQVESSPNFCLIYDDVSQVQAVVLRTNLE